MKNDFPRILTLLRKERGISQKEAAAKLGITQALLSHYEKGVRECGLDFVIAVADEYGVSTDYLLGRTSDRHGVIVTAEELPEQTDAAEDKRFNGSIVATLNKKLLVNSITILYDQLQNSKLKSLTTEVSAYLCLAVYKVFRMVYGLNPKNPEAMFAIRHNLYNGLTNAAMNVTEAYLNTIC
ncbi:MAG: helix-turn-helix transcriptional regulator, partial [Clostridia bacterium]|nr:helix-turn-helix transcriptional regulator [Clostridia bacterium]